MLEFFPDNYRWTYNTHVALASGGLAGDFSLIHKQLLDAGGNDDAWYLQWSRIAAIAEERAGNGSALTRSDNLFLASLYYLIAERPLAPLDERRNTSYPNLLRTFEAARVLSSSVMQRVLVPFEGVELPGLLLPGRGAGKRPLCIFICGADTTKELWFLRARFEFAARGISALFMDTPGIGEPLRLHGMPTRHDYERPVGAIIDWLRDAPGIAPEVDHARIGLVGSSLGGYYATRGAAFEPRIAAAVAWGAIHDYPELLRQRIKAAGANAVPNLQLLYITGQVSMEAALEHVSGFKTGEIARHINCPFLVMHGSDDKQVALADAHLLFGAVGAKDKKLVVFNGANGGSAHTQFDNHLPALQLCADWLAEKLSALA